MNEIDLTDKITKICPFLDKLCIGYDCPSFKLDSFSYSETRDGVILLKKVKGKIFTKIEEVPMAICFSYASTYTPQCRVLGQMGTYGHHYSVSVGEKISVKKALKPTWTRVNGWSSSWKKVTELPEIQSSASTMIKEEK